MNTMNMPRFSAEASLYRSSAHHQVGAMLAGLKQEGEVVPSTLSSGFCACSDRRCFCYISVTVPGYVRVNTICFSDGSCYHSIEYV